MSFASCLKNFVDETSDSPETGKKIIQVVQKLPKLRKEYQDRESAFFAQREISKSRLKEIIDDLDYHKHIHEAKAVSDGTKLLGNVLIIGGT